MNGNCVLTRSRVQIEEIIAQTDRLSSGQQSIQSGLKCLDHQLKRVAYNISEVPDMIAEARRISEEAHTELCALSILSRLGNTNQRYWDVAKAHSHTFHWILQDDLEYKPDCQAQKDFQIHNDFHIENDARKRLRSWLVSGSGIFHVSGKPGSGKSTLMKYLVQHPTVRSLLQDWAHPKRLALGIFFFWKPDRAQNSHEALIRGLLQSIIHYDASLVHWAFPKCCKESFEQLSIKSSLHMTRGEISDAFNNLVHNISVSERFRFCFFIDGLDELDEEGDQISSEIVTMLQHWVNEATGFVKICVSSRHIPVFDNMPVDHRIRLQDLTKYDIINFVQNSLQCHPAFREERKVKDEDCRKLIEAISGGAEGVFLWVKLVLRSVERGLSNADSIAVLYERVKCTPRGLEELFETLLDSIEDCHAQMAVLLLAVAMNCVQHSNCFYLSLSTCRHFFNAIETSRFSSISTAFKIDNCPESFKLTPGILESTRSKVEFQCKGLLEIVLASQGDGYYSICTGSRVKFLHRSITEFLNRWIPSHMISHGLRFSDVQNAMCWLLWAETNLFNTSINPQDLTSMNQSDLRWQIKGMALTIMQNLRAGATLASDNLSAFELLDLAEDALLPPSSILVPHRTGCGGKPEGFTWNTIRLEGEYVCGWDSLPLLAAAQTGYLPYVRWKLAKVTPSTARSIYYQHCLVHVLTFRDSLDSVRISGWVQDYTHIFETLIQTTDADINITVPQCCGRSLLPFLDEDSSLPSVFDTLWIRILLDPKYRDSNFRRDAFYMIESLLFLGGLPLAVVCIGGAADWFKNPPTFSGSQKRAGFDNIDTISTIRLREAGALDDMDPEHAQLRMICGQDDGIITLGTLVAHAKPPNITTILSLIERNSRLKDSKSAVARKLGPVEQISTALLDKHGIRRDAILVWYNPPSPEELSE